MARQARLVIPGLVHLLALRALTGVHPYPSAEDRRRFLEVLRDAAGEAVLWHAFALLPGEARLLATSSDEQALSRWVQTAGRLYVGGFNRQHNRSGTLWAGRFRCAPVEPGPWTLRVLCHVDGATTEPGASSGGQRCGGAHEWPLVDPAEYWSLGNTPFERESAYASRLAEPLTPAQTERIARCLTGGWVCGEPSFVVRLRTSMARPPAPRPRGRPRRCG